MFFLLLGVLNEDDRDFVLALYERYGDFLYKTAYDILKNQSDAEDAVQDVMCKIIKHLDKFESSSERAIQNQIVIYISSIARNTAIDAYRKRARTMQKGPGCTYRPRTARKRRSSWKTRTPTSKTLPSPRKPGRRCSTPCSR